MVEGGSGECGYGVGAGVGGVNVVPGGGGADPTKGGDDKGEEVAASLGGAVGVFLGFLKGSGMEDGVAIGDGFREVGWEEWAADSEVNGSFSVLPLCSPEKKPRENHAIRLATSLTAIAGTVLGLSKRLSGIFLFWSCELRL